MFKIESYVTPILLSYVDKYVRDFKPADAQVSLWGGGVALHNLVLKADVLQQEVALPFTLVSGRIHELLIQVPWTKIMSEPIVVTIDTIECVLSLNPPAPPDGTPVSQSPSPSRSAQVVEAPPGYMQALVRRIVSNIALRVHHLIVKYVQDDIVLSLNVKHLAVDSAGANWEPNFADIDQVHPLIRRLVRLDDLTLCLDKSDADGKIRFFQEPLLYRCQLDLRVLTRLISANTRRATSLDVQMRSGKLAWSVSNEQLVLLLRLLKERPSAVPSRTAPPPPKQTVSPAPLHTLSANSAEPTRSESWTEWAWSWLPSLADRERGVEEAPVPATALPVNFNAYLDDVSLVYKIMEVDSANRKRARCVLEVSARYAAIKSSVCSPTFQRVRFGAREVTLHSTGKCVCGFVNYKTSLLKPTVFLKKVKPKGYKDPWTWPEEMLNEKVVETVEAVEVNSSATPMEQTPGQSKVTVGDTGQPTTESSMFEKLASDKPDRDDVDELWANMAPIVFVDYVHERSAPNPQTNPYDNPPKDFEYSDWVEECTATIVVEPVNVRVSMGLIHRLMALTNIFKEQSPQAPVLPKRTLTVEENESLNENLPQRRIKMEVRNLRVSVVPWSHSLSERATPPVVVLQILLPNTSATVLVPMYPHRVCSAACQLPSDSGPLWKGARRLISVITTDVQVRLTNIGGTETRPCVRADIKLVLHELLHKAFFEKRNSVEFAYFLKIKEMSICGSSARLQTALEVLKSLVIQKRSILIKHTTLPQDALHDEDSVAIDISLENFDLRGWITDNVNTHLFSMQSAKVTALHEPKDGEIRQAWLLSAPDTPTSTYYLRLAVQWCTEPIATSFDYCGIFTEPLAMSVDPLLISWLAYKPSLKQAYYEKRSSCLMSSTVKTMSATQISSKRRPTPPSSSGRGGSRTSIPGAELVHVRSRSHGSSSEPSEKKEVKMHPMPKAQKPRITWLSAERMTALHHRLRSMLINVELGLALLYVPMNTASAIDCATLRDAMERHASSSHHVLGICLGRLSMKSNFMMDALWAQLRQDGPTYVQEKLKEESFPWKIKLADVSCYTLEGRPFFVGASHLMEAEHSGASSNLKSKIKIPMMAVPRTVLELVTTTITVSVVTKSLQYKTISMTDQRQQREKFSAEEKKMRYFTSGMDFKPTTLKEFVRGPSTRMHKVPDAESKSPPPPQPKGKITEKVTITEGPMVSLGIHLHADTPPILLRLERDQVHTVATAIHCFTHIVILLKRPLLPPKTDLSYGSNAAVIRSVSEMEEIPSASEDTSDHSEMLTIFDRSQQNQRELKTFFWFQWVVSRVTLVVASETVKLALDIDDVIGTVDIQSHYNQLKIKLASASIKHFKRDLADEWTAGVIGGRVLEAREPSNAQEDAHFLSVTITQAQVSDLPPSWKEELHPKLLEKMPGTDYMWEVFATLAPLEAVVQPNIVDNLMSLAKEMVPRSSCPLSSEIDNSAPYWQWPYIYLNAGGIRLLVIGEEAEKDTGSDDTIIFSVGKIAVNPHPENPVCRHTVNTGTEGTWLAANSGFEGHQYEFIVKSVSIQSSRFNKITIVEAEGAESKKATGTENPALKWTRRIDMPEMVPILHSVELSCIFAPALYLGGVLTCGPVVELNLVSDCSIEFSIAQYLLFRQLRADFLEALGDPSTTGVESDIFDKHAMCPYAVFIQPETKPLSEELLAAETSDDFGFMDADSGVGIPSSSGVRLSEDLQTKKSTVGMETGDASQFLEVFVTMGVIDLTLKVADDDSPEMAALRPPVKPVVKPPVPAPAPAPVPVTNTDTLRQKRRSEKTRKKEKAETDSISQESINETRRDADHGHFTIIDLQTITQEKDNFPLLQFTLFQPNVYYLRRKIQKTLQLSLFNAWVAFGTSAEGHWHTVLLSTAKGVPDPATDIPPALATFKLITPLNNSGSAPSNSSVRGTMRLDIERPVQLYVSSDKLLRMTSIIHLLKRNLIWPQTQTHASHSPFLYELKNKLINDGVENINIETGQISVCGHEGVLGWDSLSLHMCTNARPEKLDGRCVITALLVSAGPPEDMRHVVLHPLVLGIEGEAYWEAWRRAEGGLSAREPTVKISVEFDDVTLDLRPSELAALSRLQGEYNELLSKQRHSFAVPTGIPGTTYRKRQTVISPVPVTLNTESDSSLQDLGPPSTKSLSQIEINDSDHFYKDDLRSGAFKILSGGQLPMAYQVMLCGDAVSWRYPHPRAITRVVAFPLPGQNEEIDCVLELYSSLLRRWEPHTYFKLPVGEPRELQLFVSPPETVFAVLWRFRACLDPEPEPPPYEFDIKKFLSKQEPSVTEEPEESQNVKGSSEVTAEQLSGVLRVDSYFAPRLLSRCKAVVRVASLQVHVHNSLPTFVSNTTYIEGYYVSKPLKRTHRVLTLAARSTTAQALVSSPAGKLLVVDTKLSCDMVDCSTGTMEEIIEEFRLQSGISVKESLLTARSRVVTTGIQMAMQVPKLQTLRSLVTDWNNAYGEYFRESSSKYKDLRFDTTNTNTQGVAKAAADALEGRVSLWIHNNCSSAVRLGQEDTEEVVPLGSGGYLAYRWHYPTSPKRLRFAQAGPRADWKWSSSIPFIAGTYRLRFVSQDTENDEQLPMGLFLHVRVEETGASRHMHLSGRLVLANMLRESLLYKVRSIDLYSPQWSTVSSGEMNAETVGPSVVCTAACEMVLKIKFRSQNTCWSGDIPLKECPKENVPWLVKVPTEGDTHFVSVWCRVVRGRSDGRILAAMWPLYVLHSHLPLDTDVLIATDSQSTSVEPKTPEQQPPKPPILQMTPGRGTSTHLQVLGTTSARHSLSFRYREIECPVTHEAVPMHYGVTDTSVFDKRSPVTSIEDVIKDIEKWLERSGHHATKSWPYSIVQKHRQGEWQSATLQPRSDVTIRYTAVRAGGGCSLEVQLCPIVLLCNASPVSMTLRSFDAAPLCKLLSGSAISPPTAIIQKPFFMSIELGRETFVSSRLQVSTEDPGRYGTLPPGHVALDHATNFAILCNQKVALLTLYYEIKENINVLGVSSSHVLINRLDTCLLVSAIVVPDELKEMTFLRPKTFIEVPPNKDCSSSSSACGTPLCKFWLNGRWRGGDPAELRVYLCLALSGSWTPPNLVVPIRLGQPPLRRAVALIDSEFKSIPIVATQMKQDGRWLVVVAPDPCPQFVVQNHTSLTLAVAQPIHSPDEASSSYTEATKECAGSVWWRVVPPKAAVHYSTPAHCARFPPDVMPPASMASPILTFSIGNDEKQQDWRGWCAPVVAADGEQLIQYYGDVTIKLRVRTHPHSTLLELQDVDQNDISASDIRRRLQGALLENSDSVQLDPGAASAILERTDAICELHMASIESSLEKTDLPNSSLLFQPPEISPENDKRKDSLLPVDSVATTSTILHKSMSSYRFTSETTSRSAYINPDLDESWADSERFRCVIAGVAVELAAAGDVTPLLALHLDRTALLVTADNEITKTILSIADAQIDNLQYESGQYDFAVIASTRAAPLEPDRWPPLWNMFAERETFAARTSSARLLLKLTHDKWEVVNNKYNELTELEIRVGTLALYVEDAYVKALVDLSRLVLPSNNQDTNISEERSMQCPLRLRLLHVHPLDLTLTLHTAVRMYIALDQSPLRLSAFKLHDMMTSAERLTHALTVHYLSAAILGAGWVVGGLELLGAPGALAARLGGATGGVRGVASAAAAALLRSLSAWAGSLARNLDLLAGDEEHARRAAAARRRPPPSFVAGLVAGITNFAINILGAVGGLAHHPLVGVAVGETESGTAALRRGLIGALTKPLSATADLVAYAGSGLLQQTGWDPVPEPRSLRSAIEARTTAGWHRDCVRWMFRLCELSAMSGYEVLLEHAHLQLLLTHKFLVLAEPESERIVEMIDFRYCTLGPYEGEIIQLVVTQGRLANVIETRLVDEDDEYQISAAAMARVARYTGAQSSASGGAEAEERVLSLLPAPGRSHALHSALAAALHHNANTHFPML